MDILLYVSYHIKSLNIALRPDKLVTQAQKEQLIQLTEYNYKYAPNKGMTLEQI